MVEKAKCDLVSEVVNQLHSLRRAPAPVDKYIPTQGRSAGFEALLDSASFGGSGEIIGLR